MLSRITLRGSVWFAALALVIHELEEWNISPWFSRNFLNAPDLPPPAVWLGMATLSSVALLWAWGATRARNDALCAALALPLLVGVAAGNALQHLAWLFLFGAYAPGVVTASFLVLPATSLFLSKVPRSPPLFAASAVLLVLILYGAVQTYMAGPYLQAHEIALQEQFIHLARSLGI